MPLIDPISENGQWNPTKKKKVTVPVPTNMPTPTLPGAPSLPNAGGYTPDYGAILAGDPLLMQTKADLSGQGIADAAQRKSLIDSLVVQYGVSDPTKLNDQYGDVDQATIEAAKNN